MTKSASVPVVAGCVLEKDDTYLLVQERKPTAYGLWNLPAGRVDEGETLEAAAVREVREETGYQVKITSELCVVHEDISKPVLHSFGAEIIGGELDYPKEELLDAQWLTLDEIELLSRSDELRNSWVLRSIRLFTEANT